MSAHPSCTYIPRNTQNPHLVVSLLCTAFIPIGYVALLVVVLLPRIHTALIASSGDVGSIPTLSKTNLFQLPVHDRVIPEYSSSIT